MRIRTYGDRSVHTSCQPVEEVTAETREIIRRMFETVDEICAVGLAAPQVGIPMQIIVVVNPNVPQDRFALINPRIVSEEGDQAESEGCLSVPEVELDIRRAEKVTVEGLDEQGKPVKREAEGLTARILQHELDHLKGILIVDRVSPARRMLISRRLKELARRARGQGS